MFRFGVIEGKAIMSKKAKQTAIVLSQQMLAEGIYDLWLATELAKEAGAGQFIGVYPKNAATLLPRPISICEVNEDKTALRLVYRVAGKGTKEFSSFEKGDTVEILGSSETDTRFLSFLQRIRSLRRSPCMAEESGFRRCCSFLRSLRQQEGSHLSLSDTATVICS